jgi:hypothetical protein
VAQVISHPASIINQTLQYFFCSSSIAQLLATVSGTFASRTVDISWRIFEVFHICLRVHRTLVSECESNCHATGGVLAFSQTRVQTSSNSGILTNVGGFG